MSKWGMKQSLRPITALHLYDYMLCEPTNIKKNLLGMNPMFTLYDVIPSSFQLILFEKWVMTVMLVGKSFCNKKQTKFIRERKFWESLGRRKTILTRGEKKGTSYRRRTQINSNTKASEKPKANKNITKC